MAESSPLQLGRRERQLAETLYRLGEASVAQVRAELADAPSYSAVRAMLNLLVGKGVLAARQQGKRFLDSAEQPTFSHSVGMADF